MHHTLPNLTLIGPYLGISSRKVQEIAIFSTFFAPQGRLPQPIFLKFTGFMCSYSPHIRLKFGKIRFISRGFITEKLRAGHFSPKFLETRGRIPKQLLWKKMVLTSFIHLPSLVEVYARRHENENKRVFVFLFCLSVTVGVAYFGLADSQ